MSDLDGDGVSETSTRFVDASMMTWWFGVFDPAYLITPDAQRLFYMRGTFTVEGMYLNPDPINYNCAQCFFDQYIGGFFRADMGLAGTTTHYQNDTRYDETISVWWMQMYSNDVVNTVRLVDPNAYYPYVAELDLLATLTTMKNHQRLIPFTFTTVWSSASTFTYQGHSEWSGQATIVDVFEKSDAGAIPEPSAVLVVLPAVAVMAFRKLVPRSSAVISEPGARGTPEETA